MRHSRKEISIIWLILSLLMATLLVNQCLSLVYFWLNQTIGSGYLLILGVIILAVITVFLRSGVKVVLIKKEDILALGIALVMGLSFVPTLWNYNHSFRLPIITSGVDIMAHFNMFIKMTETGKLNYGSGVFDNFKPWAGWSEYPSGFYATAGTIYLTLVKPFLHSTSDPVILTSFFSLFSIGLFCWLGYWLTVLVTSVVGSKNKMGLAHWLLIFALVFYFMEGTFYNLFDYGFMAQIVGLILLIVTSILILKHQSTDNVVTYWIKLLVLNFGIANSWYFLSPLAGLWLLREAIKNNLFKEKWFYLTSMVMGGLALYPIWMSIKSFNVVKEINAGGGIIGVKGVELLIMVVICIILRSRIKTVSKKLADVSFFTFTAASYPILLGIYGLIVKGSVAYYYNKSLYTVVIYLLALTVYLIFQRMSKVKILVKDNLYLILLTVVILGVSLLTKIGERNSLFRERKVFMDREVYNAMMVAKESGLDKQYYFVPFGRFIDLISFYTYFGYLPDFYKEKYPNVDYPGYPWIFEEVKSIKSDKPLMVFDAFTVKAEFSESQKAWLKQNEIKTYPLGVEIEGGN